MHRPSVGDAGRACPHIACQPQDCRSFGSAGSRPPPPWPVRWPRWRATRGQRPDPAAGGDAAIAAVVRPVASGLAASPFCRPGGREHGCGQQPGKQDRPTMAERTWGISFCARLRESGHGVCGFPPSPDCLLAVGCVAGHWIPWIGPTLPPPPPDGGDDRRGSAACRPLLRDCRLLGLGRLLLGNADAALDFAGVTQPRVEVARSGLGELDAGRLVLAFAVGWT